ncbi:MAG: PepSY domain-containing protein [Rhodospirillaceae bacterium]|nr:PepSY domain-containing protein [Rhodospirillaceae bacterium]
MRRFLPLAALAATAGVGLPALAGEDLACGDAPRSQWLSQDAVKAKLVEQKYDVRRLKVEDGCYEAHAIGPDGARVEVYLNPVSGEVVRKKDAD